MDVALGPLLWNQRVRLTQFLLPEGLPADNGKPACREARLLRDASLHSHRWTCPIDHVPCYIRLQLKGMDDWTRDS